MKFQKMIRVPMMLMGMAAGLLVAKPVCAQQEVEPTFFEAPSQVSPTINADSATSPSVVTADPAVAEHAASRAPQDVEASAASGTVQAAIAVLMTGFGLIAFLGTRKALREDWRQRERSLRDSHAV